jgi:proline iminopeptidase
MPQEAAVALIAGAAGVGAAVALHRHGIVGTTTAYVIGAVSALGGLGRAGWVQFMSTWHTPGRIQKLDPRRFDVVDEDPNTWRMSDGERIHHFKIGEGPEVVVVLHGGPGAAPTSPWPGLEKETALLHQYTFHFYHMRGCGHSSKSVYPSPKPGSLPSQIKELVNAYGLSRNIEDLEAIRRHLGCGRGEGNRMHLIGHSFGAFYAALYVAEFQRPGDFIASALLITPADVLTTNDDGGLLTRIREHLVDPSERAAYDAYLKKMMQPNFKMTEDEHALFNAEMNKYYVSAAIHRHPSAAKFFQSSGPGKYAVGTPGYHITAAYMSLGMYRDFTRPIKTAFERAPFPVRLVFAEHDLSVGRENKQYRDVFASFVSEKTVDSGHFPQFETPEACTSLIRSWLTTDRVQHLPPRSAHGAGRRLL